jgi:hypothetical protein
METTMGANEIEIIDPEEFMKRLKIKRTTFQTWKKSGKLVRERHYIQVGAVIRIFWSMQLLLDLDDPPPDPGASPAQNQSSIQKPRNGCALDLSY